MPMTTCAAEIDREFNDLIERETWTYGKMTPSINLLPYLWGFKIMVLAGSEVEILYIEIFVLRGKNIVIYSIFDRDNEYWPVVINETVRLFSGKEDAKGLIMDGANVSNAQLSWHLKENPFGTFNKLVR